MAFHVLNEFRIRRGPMGSTNGAGNNGAFAIPSRVSSDRLLLILASDGLGWEHVSVHVEGKRGRLATPVWDEMSQVKALFWDPEDVVMQIHPRQSQYINMHPHTLHLWRPLPETGTIPEPDPALVGVIGNQRSPVPHAPACPDC